MDREPSTTALADNRARTHVLPTALLRLTQCWMDLLGPRGGQRQGLLCLIATVEQQAHGLGAPIVGLRVSDIGPLVLAL
jgi:hypothetical protein